MQEDDGLVVGMQEGLLCIRKRSQQSSRTDIEAVSSVASVPSEESLARRVNRAFYTKPTRVDPLLNDLFAIHAEASETPKAPRDAEVLLHLKLHSS